jgi:enoyl-CoA hydratase/carnithine racemase
MAEDTDGRTLPAPDGYRLRITDDGIATLVVDRPARRNALTSAMWAELPGLLDRLESDQDVRALIVTGAGDTFSAGADIDELRQVYRDEQAARAYHLANVFAETTLAGFRHPTIAVVRGACVGGGCQLAVACDLRIADRTARFGVTPAKLGVLYPSGPTLRLTRLVGPARAKYLLFTADLVDADRALVYGLVEEVVDDPAGLDARAMALARTIASRSPQSLGAAKTIIDADGDPDEAVARGGYRPSDVPEGLTAFLERRPPRFGPAG